MHVKRRCSRVVADRVSLVLVVTVKYLMFIMRAHNKGEGGIFACSPWCRVACAHITRRAWRCSS